ncbi:recombinase family protein [Streptomyces sp. NPDC048208]|uniref:recombinase family protein n=1 Tax=Streptomyces sp. NPDC048208 TaxID=3365515 RepID=UPI00371AA0BD
MTTMSVDQCMREDYPALKKLGFRDDELRDLGLWEVPTGLPAELAELYIRRSKAKEDVATLRGHVRDGARWAEREKLTIRHVWFEQRSASKVSVRRDEFEKAKEAVIEHRHSRTLAVWKTDRLDRRGMGTVGTLLDQLDQRNSRLVSISEGVDSSRGGRLVFAILSERAREEARDIGKRAAIGHDSHRKDVSAGRRGTGQSVYGLFSPVGSGKVEHHTTEYEKARQMAEWLIDDVPAKQVAHRANKKGWKTRAGKEWTVATVAAWARSPMLGGMVPVRERMLDEDGNPLDVWEKRGHPLLDPKGNPARCGNGVVTPGEWYKINALMDARLSSDGTFNRGKVGPRHLLTGGIRCPHCRVRLNAHNPYYKCPTNETKGRSVCVGRSTLIERIDAYVVGAWIRHVTALDDDDPVLHEIARRWLAYNDPEHEARKQELTGALGAARQRLKALEDRFYVQGRISEGRFDEMSRTLEEQIANFISALEGLRKSQDMSALFEADMWVKVFEHPDTTLSEKRALLFSAVEWVDILPSTGRGDRRPIESLVTIKWVGTP